MAEKFGAAGFDRGGKFQFQPGGALFPVRRPAVGDEVAVGDMAERIGFAPAARRGAAEFDAVAVESEVARLALAGFVGGDPPAAFVQRQ